MNNSTAAAPGAVETTVQASINERRFFESMKHLFASSFSVIGELMQNARRAGASKIDFKIDIENKTASILDDGCGIDDFQLLISLCDSGWSEQVTLTDKPFGMGLFSLFFAANSVAFRSNGRRLEVSLDDIIQKRRLSVHDDHEPGVSKGTRVDLIGLNENMLCKGHSRYSYSGATKNEYAIFNEIEVRAKGFPLPVLINGKECSRPHAQANLKGVASPIGFVSYLGVTNDAKHIPEVREHLLYLQGLPIGHQRRSDAPIIVHLEPSTFTARMPDRSDLFDPTEQMARVLAELRNMVAYRLTSLKAALPGEDFVKFHWDNCRSHDLLHLMNDIPWVPEKCLNRVQSVVREAEEVWINYDVDSLVPRSDFLAGKVKAWFDPPASTDDSPHAALVLKVMQSQQIVEPIHLSADHWLRKLAPSVNDLEFAWRPHGVNGEAVFWNDLGSCTIHLCESIEVEVTCSVDHDYRMSIVSDDGWMLVPAGQHMANRDTVDVSAGDLNLVCYVIGQGNAPDHPVDALNSFRDDNQVYRDEWREDASKDWTQKIRAMKGVSLCQMVQTVLQGELTNLDSKQAQQMAIVRTVQRRSGTGQLSNPQPDVIDLMDQQFWIKVAQAMDQGAFSDPMALAERFQHAFTHVVQPGFQEPPVDNQ